MATSQRMPQCNTGIRVLINHPDERATVSDLKINNTGSYKIWRFKDGYSVLKYGSAVIACYSPLTNEIQSVNTKNSYWLRHAVQKYSVLETRD